MTDWSTVVWRKSARCESNSCVEVGLLNDQIALRDSKDVDGPVLLFTRDEWSAFVHGAQRGEFDLLPDRS
jgi:Domain of unknown function (DUF397)